MPPPLRNLRDFLNLLRLEREVVEIDTRVSSDQEIAEIHRRVISAGGPALLFTNIEGSDFPLATNLFGTRKRAEMAFGGRADRFIRDAVHFVERAFPPTSAKLWAHRHLALDALRLGTRRTWSAPVADVAESPRLSRLPLLKLWPEDGGHFLTLPLVFTKSPADGRHNLGIYRMQRYDDARLGMHWQIGKGGGFHYAEAEARDEALPVTVFLGGPPALIMAAIAPLPEGVPELLLASLMLGEKLPLADEAPHAIPAECEFALVGHVPPRERAPEGPFGDHYGYYSLTHPYPVFHCDRVLRRSDAIMPATVVGKPRQEDFHIGDCLQELLSPLFPLVMPSVRQLWSYGETGFHSLAAAVVRDRYPREAMMSAFRILGEGQLSLTKFLLLTDGDVDLRDFPALIEHVLARANWETDLYVFSNLSMDSLDYAGPEVNKGSKGVIAALGPAVRELPREFRGELPGFARNPRVFCPGCLVLGGAAYAEDSSLPGRIAEWASLNSEGSTLNTFPLVVLCDNPSAAAASTESFLWTTFTRFEPAADLHAASTRIVRSHIARTGPLVLDARMKPWYPKEVAVAPEIAARVEKRWREYFPHDRVAMGAAG